MPARRSEDGPHLGHGGQCCWRRKASPSRVSHLEMSSEVHSDTQQRVSVVRLLRQHRCPHDPRRIGAEQSGGPGGAERGLRARREGASGSTERTRSGPGRSGAQRPVLPLRTRQQRVARREGPGRGGEHVPTARAGRAGRVHSPRVSPCSSEARIFPFIRFCTFSPGSNGDARWDCARTQRSLPLLLKHTLGQTSRLSAARTFQAPRVPGGARPAGALFAFLCVKCGRRNSVSESFSPAGKHLRRTAAATSHGLRMPPVHLWDTVSGADTEAGGSMLPINSKRCPVTPPGPPGGRPRSDALT